MVLIQHYYPYRTYVSIDHLSSLILSLGREALLIKADIKEAYWMVPIHPQDQWLLGVQWRGVVFIDRVLPFDLRSAPKIFSAVFNAPQWILSTKAITYSIHYLDEYIMVTNFLNKATIQKDILISTFESLGVPLEYSKLEGPSSCISGDWGRHRIPATKTSKWQAIQIEMWAISMLYRCSISK